MGGDGFAVDSEEILVDCTELVSLAASVVVEVGAESVVVVVVVVMEVVTVVVVLVVVVVDGGIVLLKTEKGIRIFIYKYSTKACGVILVSSYKV